MSTRWIAGEKNRKRVALEKHLLIERGPGGRMQYAERWLHCPYCYDEPLFATPHRYTAIEERWFCIRCGHRAEPGESGSET